MASNVSFHLQQRLDEHWKQFQAKVNQMCEKCLSSTLKIEENERLKNELTEMKSELERLQMPIGPDQMKRLLELDLDNAMEKLRSQRSEYDAQISCLEDSLRSAQKQTLLLQQTHRSTLEKHKKDKEQDQERIRRLEGKILRDDQRTNALLHSVRRFSRGKMEKRYAETTKQLENVVSEEDESLAEMSIAVRVTSEMRHGEKRIERERRELFDGT